MCCEELTTRSVNMYMCKSVTRVYTEAVYCYDDALRSLLPGETGFSRSYLRYCSHCSLVLYVRFASKLHYCIFSFFFFNPHPALVICNCFSMQNEKKKKKSRCHRLKFSPFYLPWSSSFLSPSPTNRRTDFVETRPEFQKLFGEGNNML